MKTRKPRKRQPIEERVHIDESTRGRPTDGAIVAFVDVLIHLAQMRKQGLLDDAGTATKSTNV